MKNPPTSILIENENRIDPRKQSYKKHMCRTQNIHRYKSYILDVSDLKFAPFQPFDMQKAMVSFS